MENGNNLIHSFNDTDYKQGNSKGLTKREYIATSLLSGLSSVPNTGLTANGLVKKAIELTDELLKQLEETNQQ